MKNVILFLVIGFLTLASVAHAESRCGLYATAAASEEAVLRFDEFEHAARLEEYTLQILESGEERESFQWLLPDEGTTVSVTTEFNGKQCTVLEVSSLYAK